MSETTAKTKTRAPQKIVKKGHREFHHHLFKLGVAKMKKNLSWIEREPEIVEVEHVHFFHSVDEVGAHQVHCSPVGGHVHEVTFEIEYDEKGEPTAIKRAVCGPPLKTVYKSAGRGKPPVKRLAPISFPAKLENGDDVNIDDKHTHEVEYIDTEVLTAARLQAYREDARQGVAAMLKPATNVPPGTVAQNVAVEKVAESAAQAGGIMTETTT